MLMQLKPTLRRHFTGNSIQMHTEKILPPWLYIIPICLLPSYSCLQLVGITFSSLHPLKKKMQVYPFRPFNFVLGIFGGGYLKEALKKKLYQSRDGGSKEASEIKRPRQLQEFQTSCETFGWHLPIQWNPAGLERTFGFRVKYSEMRKCVVLSQVLLAVC